MRTRHISGLLIVANLLISTAPLYAQRQQQNVDFVHHRIAVTTITTASEMAVAVADSINFTTTSTSL